MRRTAREEVRSFRAFLRKKYGPDWREKFIEGFAADERNRDWTKIEMTVYGEHHEIIVQFVICCRGGFDGERLEEEGLDGAE